MKCSMRPAGTTGAGAGRRRGHRRSRGGRRTRARDVAQLDTPLPADVLRRRGEPVDRVPLGSVLLAAHAAVLAALSGEADGR